MSAWRHAGYWHPLSIDGTPVLLHWTLPVVGFAVCRLSPVAWAAYLGVVLWHVLGHAIAVEAAGARATQWEVTGFGGAVRYRTTVGGPARVAIAWSGVASQMVLLSAALIVRAFFDFPSTPAEVALDAVLVKVNLALMAVELLPSSSFDGGEAWDFLKVGGLGPRVERRPRGPDPDPDARRLTPEERAENERTFQKILAEMRSPGRVERRDDED